MRNTEATVLLDDNSDKMLVFHRHNYGAEHFEFEISIEDRNRGPKSKRFKEKLRRAWRAFCFKPPESVSIWVKNPEEVWAFLENCDRIATKGGADG